MTDSTPSISVLWYTPDKPADISVGRQRIADHLDADGISVDLRGTTLRTALSGLREASEYDAIVGTTRAGAIVAAIIATLRRRPLVVDHVDPIAQFERTHPQWLASLVRRLEHASFQLADHVLYVYPTESGRVDRRARASTKTDLGLEFERFAAPARPVVDRARTTLAERDVSGNVALYVGGLEPIYNVETMLDAVGRLDEWTLVILGAGSLEGTVHAAASRRDDVVFLGTVPHEDVPGYLHCADVGLCLVDDARTLKTLEYGAAGLPVVHLAGDAEARFEAYAEFCRNEPGDVARAIRHAAERPAGSAFQRYVEAFDWEEIAADYATVLGEIASSNRR